MIPHIAEHHEGGVHAKAAEFLIVPERHSRHHLQQNLRLLVQDALLLLLLRGLPLSPALRVSPSALRALLPPFRSTQEASRLLSQSRSSCSFQSSLDFSCWGVEPELIAPPVGSPRSRSSFWATAALWLSSISMGLAMLDLSRTRADEWYE